jgi:hypothetical protein
MSSLDRLQLARMTDGAYESRKTDGRRFRNTEVLTFAGEKISKAEVYFGWDL